MPPRPLPSDLSDCLSGVRRYYPGDVFPYIKLAAKRLYDADREFTLAWLALLYRKDSARAIRDLCDTRSDEFHEEHEDTMSEIDCM